MTINCNAQNVDLLESQILSQQRLKLLIVVVVIPISRICQGDKKIKRRKENKQCHYI